MENYHIILISIVSLSFDRNRLRQQINLNILRHSSSILKPMISQQHSVMWTNLWTSPISFLTASYFCQIMSVDIITTNKWGVLSGIAAA